MVVRSQTTIEYSGMTVERRGSGERGRRLEGEEVVQDKSLSYQNGPQLSFSKFFIKQI